MHAWDGTVASFPDLAHVDMMQGTFKSLSKAQRKAAAAYLQRGGLPAIMDLLQCPPVMAALNQQPARSQPSMAQPGPTMVNPTALEGTLSLQPAICVPMALYAFCSTTAQQPSSLGPRMPSCTSRSPLQTPLPLLRAVRPSAFPLLASMPALRPGGMASSQSSQPQSGLVTSTCSLGDTAQPCGSGMIPCSETPSAGGSRHGLDGEKRAAISNALVKLALDYIGQDQPFGTRSIEGLIRHCLLSSSRWVQRPFQPAPVEESILLRSHHTIAVSQTCMKHLFMGRSWLRDSFGCFCAM